MSADTNAELLFDVDGYTTEGTINFLKVKKLLIQQFTKNHPRYVSIIETDTVQVPALPRYSILANHDDPTEKAQAKNEFELAGKIYQDELKAHRTSMEKTFGLLQSSCSTSLLVEMKKDPLYVGAVSSLDTVILWKLMKKYIFYDAKERTDALVKKYKAVERYQRFHQVLDESIVDFRDRFDLEVEILETACPNYTIIAKGDTREKDLAITFLHKLNRRMYQEFIEEIKNNFVMNNVPYPESISKVLTLAKEITHQPQLLLLTSLQKDPMENLMADHLETRLTLLNRRLVKAIVKLLLELNQWVTRQKPFQIKVNES